MWYCFLTDEWGMAWGLKCELIILESGGEKLWKSPYQPNAIFKCFLRFALSWSSESPLNQSKQRSLKRFCSLLPASLFYGRIWQELWTKRPSSLIFYSWFQLSAPNQMLHILPKWKDDVWPRPSSWDLFL